MSDFEVAMATVMTEHGPELQLVDLAFCGDGTEIHIGKPTKRVGDDQLGAHGVPTVKQYELIVRGTRISHIGDMIRDRNRSKEAA